MQKRARVLGNGRPCKHITYVAVLVHLVVGELHFLEGDDLLLELVAGVGRVGVGVEAVGRRRVSLASHQPGRPVIGVPVDTRR